MTYADVVGLLSGYPPEAPILIDMLADPDCSTEFEAADQTVGKLLEFFREMPAEDPPIVGTRFGPHLLLGVYYSVTAPILVMIPVPGDGTRPVP